LSERHEVGGSDYKILAGERNMNREFPIATPVRFLWRDSYGALHLGVGISHHISRSDVRIRAQHVPSVGARVQVIVDMPPAKANTRPGRLTGHGVVEYVEHEDRQPVVFAVRVHSKQRWAYRPAPLGNEASRRENTVVSPNSQQEPLVGSTDPEHREFFCDVNVYKLDGLSR
jgi:hypothetical protein